MRSGKVILALVILAVFSMQVSVQAIAASSEWDFNEGAPPEYFIGTWVLKAPAPSLVVKIDEFIGREDAGGIINDFYRGSVLFPAEFGIPKITINQIPEYSFTQTEVFYFSLAQGKDLNAICVTRVGDQSSILIRATYQDNGEIAYLKIQGNGQKVHEVDRMYLLMVHVKGLNDWKFVTPSSECFEIIELVRQP